VVQTAVKHSTHRHSAQFTCTQNAVDRTRRTTAMRFRIPVSGEEQSDRQHGRKDVAQCVWLHARNCTQAVSLTGETTHGLTKALAVPALVRSFIRPWQKDLTADRPLEQLMEGRRRNPTHPLAIILQRESRHECISDFLDILAVDVYKTQSLLSAASSLQT
jgi:hypothetical protein